VPVDAWSLMADLRLSLPEESTLARATPVVPLNVTQRVTARAFRPRLVLYGDEDGDGHFRPAIGDAGGPDRLLSIDDDEEGYAAILDLPELLEALPLDDAETFYRATNDHYTPFVYTSGRGSLGLLRPPSSVLLSFDPAVAKASFECRRSVRAGVGVVEHEIVLDEAVSPELCELGNGSCAVAALAELEPPELPAGSYCRSDSDVEALIAVTRRSTCNGCSCARDTVLRVWIASKDALPDDWPCGRDVYSCSEERKLTLSLGCGPA
jgi:hypothetical protein